MNFPQTIFLYVRLLSSQLSFRILAFLLSHVLFLPDQPVLRVHFLWPCVHNPSDLMETFSSIYILPSPLFPPSSFSHHGPSMLPSALSNMVMVKTCLPLISQVIGCSHFELKNSIKLGNKFTQQRLVYLKVPSSGDKEILGDSICI